MQTYIISLTKEADEAEITFAELENLAQHFDDMYVSNEVAYTSPLGESILISGVQNLVWEIDEQIIYFRLDDGEIKVSYDSQTLSRLREIGRALEVDYLITGEIGEEY